MVKTVALVALAFSFQAVWEILKSIHYYSFLMQKNPSEVKHCHQEPEMLASVVLMQNAEQMKAQLWV